MTQKIGLFGYGVVAQGFVEALRQNTHFDVQIAGICIKDPLKSRDLPPYLFTTDPQVLLADPEISIIIELTNDAESAFWIAEQALSRGKAVISANKKMIAEHITEVASWHAKGYHFLYEGAVGGSIPILHNLEQYFQQQQVTEIRGILNGTTNYVLSQMRDQQISFTDALTLAQKNGFAESDPSADISGTDAMYKLIILTYHSFGHCISAEQIRVESITNMEDWFYEMARQNGQKIKSIAHAYWSKGQLRLKVQPEVIGQEDDLFQVDQENNAVVVTGTLSGKQIYMGKGAGSLPTGSAVINDLSLLLQGFRYQNTKAPILPDNQLAVS